MTHIKGQFYPLKKLLKKIKEHYSIVFVIFRYFNLTFENCYIYTTRIIISTINSRRLVFVKAI